MPERMGLSKARTSAVDRRGARRYTLNWLAKVVASDATGEFEQPATLRNLSATGALTVLQTSPSLGERLLVSFRLPFEKESWMRYSATVVRIESQPLGIGVAVRFDKSRPEFL